MRKGQVESVNAYMQTLGTSIYKFVRKATCNLPPRKKKKSRIKFFFFLFYFALLVSRYCSYANKDQST